jgi:hypothetical protein
MYFLVHRVVSTAYQEDDLGNKGGDLGLAEAPASNVIFKGGGQDRESDRVIRASMPGNASGAKDTPLQGALSKKERRGDCDEPANTSKDPGLPNRRAIVSC